MKKQLLLISTLFIACWGLAQDSTKATRNSKNAGSDFVTKAANGGMMEVELGKYAQQNANAQRVKDFGAMMERDHSRVNAELKSICQSKGMSIPSSMDAATKNHTDKMKMNVGEKFDRAYIDMMVNDHKKDIGEFEKAEKSVKDNDLRAFITKTLPTLRTHLDSAQAIQSSVKGMK